LLEYLEMANMYLKNCAFCDNLIAPGLKVCLSHMTIEIDGVNIPYAVYKEYDWFQMLAAAEQVQYREEKTKITLATQNQNMRRAQSVARKETVIALRYKGNRTPKQISYLLGVSLHNVWKILLRDKNSKRSLAAQE